MATKKKPLKARPVLGESRRIIGIDPSLTATGIAVVDLSGEVPQWRVGLVKSEPHGDDLEQLIHRIDGIVRDIDDFVQWQPGDVAVIEGYMLTASASRGPILANWHNVVASLVRRGIVPTVIAPATRAKYATGGGDGGKDKVIIQCMKRFPQADVSNNDEADAVFLASLGGELTGHSVEPVVLPATHRSFEKLFLPA